MRRILILPMLTAAWIAAGVDGSVRAVEVRACDSEANAANVVEPWERNTKTFYNGKVRVAYLDTGGEPACCSGWLLVLAPDATDETGERSCHVIGDKNGTGFSDIAFDRLNVHYDPRKGLLVTFPYTVVGRDREPGPAGLAKVRINVSSGRMTVEK